MLIFDMRVIGNRLLEIRKKAGLTQARVAEKAGLSDRTYAEIERGTTNMRIETLLRICEALKVTPDEIFTNKEDEIKLEEKSVFEKFEKCSAHEKKTALSLLEIYFKSLGY